MAHNKLHICFYALVSLFQDRMSSLMEEGTSFFLPAFCTKRVDGAGPQKTFIVIITIIITEKVNERASE